MTHSHDSADQSQSQTGLLAALDRHYSKVENFTNWLSSLAILTLMAMAVYQIVGRKIFNAPIFGYVDIIEQVMIVFAFIGVSYCQRLGGHVRMELLIDRMGRGRFYWTVEFLATVVALVLVGVMIPNSYEHFMRALEYGDTSINLDLPIWPSKLVIPVALSILGLRLLLQLFGFLRQMIDPTREPVAVPVILHVEDEAAREIHDALGDDVDVAFDKKDGSDASR